MLISGAAAGMAAVFRAPLTGIVFALEMPYKDDLAHEALLPALIASVVSYGTLATIVGPEPLFGFAGTVGFRPIDLAWSAGLGAACGLIAMVYTITFRRFRSLMVHLSIPHTGKMAIGGLLTGICGLIFVTAFPGNLIPIGPNYEAVRTILNRPYASGELVCFAALKLAATLFSLGVGGVSAMFVPLFLTGGAIGSAFARSVVHASTFDLYAAVGMASFIAAGYKTPLTAVVFVAETTGGHSFLIPSLIGAACAYAISGEASASGDQRLHEVVKFGIVTGVPVRAVMRREIISVEGSSTLAEFANAIGAHSHHGIFPVFDRNKVIGVLPVWSLAEVPCDRWERTRVSDVCNVSPALVRPDCDVMEALRILTREDSQQMLIVASGDGSVEGLVTKTDILRSLENGGHVLTNNAGSTVELTE
jgi:CIC family chloride channel protein